MPAGRTLHQVYAIAGCTNWRKRIVNCCVFFQAEDCIRDDLVTGVQTCALPISGSEENYLIIARELERVKANITRARSLRAEASLTLVEWLSILDAYQWKCAYCQEKPFEEIGRARVGKECRSRWSPYH